MYPKALKVGILSLAFLRPDGDKNLKKYSAENVEKVVVLFFL